MAWSAPALVGGGSATGDAKYDKTMSIMTSTSTTGTRSILLRFPLEVRERIYKFVCDEISNADSDLLFRQGYINSGRGLLLVNRQIHDEAKPFIYRTLKLNGHEPTWWLRTIEDSNHWQYTRTVKLNFTCFCKLPVGSYEAGTRDFPDIYPNTWWGDQWFTILTVVKNLPFVEEVCVNFDTCCRLPLNVNDSSFARLGIDPTDPTALAYSNRKTWELRLIMEDRGFCVGMENYFLRLLEARNWVDKLTVRGSVPPSWLIHLLKPGNDGFKFKLHYMSDALCNYINNREVVALAEEGLATAAPDAFDPYAAGIKTAYPAYPKQGAFAILVNANRDRKISLWEKNMGQECSGIPTEGEYSFMEILKNNRTPGDLEMSLDYTNSMSVPPTLLTLVPLPGSDDSDLSV